MVLLTPEKRQDGNVAGRGRALTVHDGIILVELAGFVERIIEKIEELCGSATPQSLLIFYRFFTLLECPAG
jgi:hypothetical protein